MDTTYKWWIGGAIAAGLVGGFLYTHKATAADLGGNCCADLEERIAELEATVARKGNRKVSLTISGEVSKAILWHDIDGLAGANKLRVIDNPNSGTKLRFSGEAKASNNLKVGFIVELGIDTTRGAGLGPVMQGLNDDVEVRHSAAWIETGVGRLTLGKTSTATDRIVEMDVSNSGIASRAMSVEPIWTYTGLAVFGGNLLNPTPFHDLRAEVVRYDSPSLNGFVLSAAWGGGQTVSGDDLFDVAMRYAGEFSGFRVAAGAGYRVDKFNSFGGTDQKTLSGSGSMMHIQSGLFLNGAYARQNDNPLFGDLVMWQARGGIERSMVDGGKTTFFAEYGDHRLKDMAFDSTFWGVGVVQAVDAIAADLFVSYRKYDLGGAMDASVGMAGIRIKF